MRITRAITAKRVLRCEGNVWRYDFYNCGVQHRGEKESVVYTHLVYTLGYTKAQALAIIECAKADAAVAS